MSNDTDLPEVENQEEEQPTSEVEEVEETNEELDKAKEVAENQKIRAEKAEKELKALKAKPEEVKETPKNEGLSNEDLLALTDVKNKEDRKFLIEKSKELGKSIEELQEDPYMQAALKTMDDNRTSADATSTGKGNRGSKGSSPESVVEAHQSGKEIDPVKVAEAEHALAMKRVQQ